uniref:GH16 domain-containing protein n=1 Tax=Megaselia scalaris TaxID=36166 RepID=T1GKW3_MEGSC
MIFEETFTNLNSSIWQNVIQIPSDSYDSDFVTFMGRRENIYVSAGNLHIVPSLLTDIPGYRSVQRGQMNLGKDCTPTSDFEKECYRQPNGYRILSPVVSGKIRTKDSFSFKYGRVVVRAKMPKGDWIFPLITLEPTAFNYGATITLLDKLELLILEEMKNLSDQRDFLKSKRNNEHYGNQFYNFELLWTPKSLRFYVDDVQYGEIKPNNLANTNIKHASIWSTGEELAPFDKEFHLSLGLSVGGVSDFPDSSLNGVPRRRKPWANDDPKAELNFWKKTSEWLQTWDGVNS